MDRFTKIGLCFIALLLIVLVAIIFYTARQRTLEMTQAAGPAFYRVVAHDTYTNTGEHVLYQVGQSCVFVVGYGTSLTSQNVDPSNCTGH